MLTLKNQEKNIDRLLLIVVFILVAFGLLMIFESSSVTAFRDFGDKFYYVRQQLVWAVIGFIVMVFFSIYDYHKYEKMSPILFGITFVLLVLVLIPGIGTRILGAKRWLNILGINLQPAELAKITFVIYLSSFFSKKNSFMVFLAILSLTIGLVMLEPDLGTTVVLATSGFCVYFASGASLVSLGVLTISGFLSGLGLILSSAYRKERLMTFLNMGHDPLGSSYHIRQVLLALGSGGLWGLGVGASRQKFEYLPEAMTDSIFAIIAEEFGFIGSTLVILLLFFIVIRGFMIAKNAPDKFGQLLAIGISSWFGIQILVNLASQVALVPLTGIPLLLISYGGSSLVITMMAVGILLNISRHCVKNR